MVASNPALIAAVKVDPDATYRRMVDVLDQLLGVGAERVSLQVLPK
jgi:biopolymer transport protein ExbD